MEFLHKKQTDADRLLGISSEDAVSKIGNRYDLVLIASRRARELSRGDQPRLLSRRGPVVTALSEIEAGLVGRQYLLKEQDIDPPRRRRSQ
jgi:DNA-directed RNA polymerase subunit omega